LHKNFDKNIQNNLLHKIYEKSRRIRFDKDKHKYFLDTFELCSVTSHLDSYKKEFETYKIANRLCKLHNEKYSLFNTLHERKPEYYVELWTAKRDMAAARGTYIHLYAQNFPYFDEPKIKEHQFIIDYFNDLSDDFIFIGSEIKVYSTKLKIAGTLDGLLWNKNTNKLVLLDWKGLPLDTPILTNKGWINMEKLTLEHKVFDKEGNICNINHISDIHEKKCLKIKFDNNEEIVSDFEHRWLIHKGFNKNPYVMTTQEIKDYFDKEGMRLHSKKTLRIYNPKPLNNRNKKLPIDPYVFGIWLGDGHSADGKVTQMNPEVWNEIEKRGYKLGNDVSQGGSGKAQTRTIFGLATELRKLNLLKNKHLPEIFLLSSFEQRLDILRGFMDADGYYNKTRKRFVLSTTRKKQVNFSVELLASLGLKSTVIDCYRPCNNKKIKAYDICFTTSDFNPFLSRNKNINLKVNNIHKYRRIISVEDTEQVKTKCIEVDSPSHTYLATKSLIVTHNTNQEIHKKDSGNLAEPFSKFKATKLNTYMLQLNFYKFCLEEMFEKDLVEKLEIVWLNEINKSYELIPLQILDLKEYLNIV
jgi:hypothetical protein